MHGKRRLKVKIKFNNFKILISKLFSFFLCVLGGATANTFVKTKNLIKLTKSYENI